MSDAQEPSDRPPLTSLTKTQRRVLGTLVEKAITVAESYPLTLKALTAGCNQKSNRDPVTSYSEDDVHDTVEELRVLGLAAVVHTESGRTERFRHYLRQRIAELSEPQVAILTELLLRGRQPAGDLRARASRMAPAGMLDSVDQLRHELTGLLSRRLIQTDGSLDRRGVEVDHNLYEPREARTLAQRAADDDPSPPMSAAPVRPAIPAASPAPRPAQAPAGSAESAARLDGLESACAALRAENAELRSQLDELRDEVKQLTGELRKLREALGA